MGMVSEIYASLEAERLEKVLVESLKEDYSVINFCKKHIIPLYKDSIHGTYGGYKCKNMAVKKVYEVD